MTYRGASDLQRLCGNRATGRVIQSRLAERPPRDAPGRVRIEHQAGSGERIGRFIMTDHQWSKLAKGSTGSAQFTAISKALNEYNHIDFEAGGARTQELAPDKRLAKVEEILSAIADWRAFKSRTKDPAKSKRAAGINQLEMRARRERAGLQELVGARAAPTTPDEIRLAADEIYNRGMHAAFRFVGLEPTEKTREEVTGYWKSFRTEAARLDRRAVALTKGSSAAEQADARNADAHSLVVREAMRAFRTITYAHLKVQKSRRVGALTDPVAIRQSIVDRAGELETAPARDADQAFMERALKHIDQLVTLSGAEKWAAAADVADVEPEDQAHLELIDSIFSAVDDAFTMTGYQGTGGQGNEGFQEFYKTDAHAGFREAFSRLESTDAATNARISGSSDIVSALAGLGGDVSAAYQAWKTWKDPESSSLEKASAMTTLIATPLTVVSQALKIAGGARHIHEVVEGVQGGSRFLPESAGTAATDVKMAGDFAGLFAGFLGTISQFLDYLSWAQEKAEDPKTEERKLAFYGDLLRRDVGVVTSLAGNAKAAAKLGYQITQDTVAQGVATSPVIPALGLIMAVLNTLRSAQHLYRFSVRRSRLRVRIKEEMESVQRVEALELARETLDKRINRAGLDLGRALTSIVAGAFNVSGVGIAPGMVASLAVTASEIGQVGLRTAKKGLREKKAESRARKGKEETFEHWKLRKLMEAAGKGSVWARLKTKVDVAITRNWDKVKSNKKARASTAALEILDMNDDVVFKALGVKERLAATKDQKKRLKIVIGALEKR